MNKLKVSFFILFGLLIVSFGFNLFQFDTIRDSQHQVAYIDNDFTAGLGRLGGAIKEGNMDFALELAYQNKALSKYTSFAKENFRINFYAPAIAESIRFKYLNHQEINKADEICNLLIELSKEPGNEEKADRLFLLLKAE